MGSKFKTPSKVNFENDLYRLKSENDVNTNNGYQIQEKIHPNKPTNKKLLGSKQELPPNKIAGDN